MTVAAFLSLSLPLGLAAVTVFVLSSEEPTASAAGDVKTVTVEGQAAPAETVTVTETVEKTAEKEAEKAEAPVAEEAPAETAAQENARQSAESYLEFSAFSRKGLIRQLKYEGYSTKDATYAVDAINANWNKQAAKAAQNYLDMSSFSRSGLIEQLEYEGYTTKQATYGVNTTGL